MKQTVRFNTFETNSSSTHNMIIIPDDEWNKWQNNTLLYLRYTWGHYNEKLLKANNGQRLFTKEFLENCDIFEGADKIPLKKDYEDEDDYEQALREWYDDMDFVDCDYWNDCDLECEDTEFITKSGEKLHILCQYGYDG